jgi:3-carboxy-cis,cis-muconate cycloisomerase
MGDILTRLINLFSGIRLFPERMRQNLDLSGGLIMAEALMLELGHMIGRQRAHDAVYDAAQATATKGGTFREHLAAHPEVSSRLSAERVEALLEPAQYTGMCIPFAERGALKAREVANAIKQRLRQ